MRLLETNTKSVLGKLVVCSSRGHISTKDNWKT